MRNAGWRFALVFALLAALAAGCDRLACQQPATPPPSAAAGPQGSPADEQSARQLYDAMIDRYRSQDEMFIPEVTYDTIIAQLRAGVARYPATSQTPKLQLLLADMVAEQRQVFNKREMELFNGLNDGVGFDTAVRGTGVLPFDMAIAEYEKVAAQWPQTAEAALALERVGDLYLAEFNPGRDPRRAVEYYRRVLENCPQAGNADYMLFRIGNTYRELALTGRDPADEEQAKRYFLRLLTEYPQFPPDSLDIARNYLEQRGAAPAAPGAETPAP